MSGALTVAAVCAVLLCWVVGAYNRLVRLRGAARKAFVVLLGPLRQKQALAEQVTAQLLAGASDGAEESAGAAVGGLMAAGRQFGASLIAAQQRPLEVEALRSLGAAEAVLLLAWQRHLADPPLAAVDEGHVAEWQTVAAAQAHASVRYDEAAARYNAAAGQFPTRIVAALFGLRKAGAFHS